MTAEPLQPEFESLYHRAFADFKLRALWKVRELEHPTAEEALVITRSLRVEGDLNARRLAEQIERACRPAVAGLTSRSGKLCGRGNAPDPCHAPVFGRHGATSMYFTIVGASDSGGAERRSRS